jgi:hypothetical protein
VNFYLPLLTMIIISCRIMVAIRSRSKMELGRRISSTTQKLMKQDRTNTVSSIRTENQGIFKFDGIDDPPLSPTIVTKTFDLSIPEHQSISNNIHIVPMIEPGQCFCSTCQTFNETGNDSLWQLQQTPIKKSYSSLQKRLSFAQINPISMIFSSTTNTKDKKKHKSQDLFDKSSNNENSIRNSSCASNNMKYAMIINSTEYSEKNVSSKIDKKLNKRSASIPSSFSDEDSDVNSTDKHQKSELPGKMTA